MNCLIPRSLFCDASAFVAHDVCVEDRHVIDVFCLVTLWEGKKQSVGVTRCDSGGMRYVSDQIGLMSPQ